MEVVNKKPLEKIPRILVNKKINFIKKGESNETKTFEPAKNNKDILNNETIKENQFEIKEKKIIFKMNGEEKKKILGKILTEFNLNKNENHNIFDNNNIFSMEDKDKYHFKKENKIKEIKIKNMNNKFKNISDIKNQKKLIELEINDLNNNINAENDFNKDLNSNDKNSFSNLYFLNTETFVESVRNRKRPKNLSLNNFNFNFNDNFNQANTYKDFHKTPKNYDRIHNNINNINNINNNISLNNRYNFYIKIGRTSRNDLKKDNIAYELKLDSATNKNNHENPSKFFKKLINKYKMDNLKENKYNITQDINVKTKPLFKKLEVQKVLNNKIKIKRESRNNNKIQKTRNNKYHSFNKTNLRFLVHQAFENRSSKTSFNKYFKSNVEKTRRSQSNQYISNSLNYSSLVNNTDVNFERNSESKNNNKKIHDSGLIGREIKFQEKKIFKKRRIKDSDIMNYNKNINLKKSKNKKTFKIKETFKEINKNNSQTERIAYNYDNNNNSTNREIYHHSKVNSTLSSLSLNSNFNSIKNLNKMNNNMNINNRILSPTSSITSNISFFSIDLEILYVLQEKLKLISENLKKSKKCKTISFDYINYYFKHNFWKELINLVKSPNNKTILMKYIKIELLCLFLLYNNSFEEEIKEIEIILKSIFNLLYKNFLVTISFIITKYKNKNNNIVIILNKIIKDNFQNDDSYKTLNESKYIKIIENNLNKISDYYAMIIENIYKEKVDGNNNIKFPDYINNKKLTKNKFEIKISQFFVESFNKLSDITIEMIKNFFFNFLTYKETLYKNIKEGKINSINNKSKFLLPKIRERKYTLILELDETLVFSQINFNDKKNNKIILPKTTLIIRPGLQAFLHDMKLLYELILFSARNQDYVDPIVKLIEKHEKYFDYILYEQHMVVDENGDRIKNLNLIGRNLNSVIIIDNVSKNYKLQKENGICIKPFCGNIASDKKTLKTLNNVLQRIRFDADKTKDIRISLNKYKYLLYPIVINDY